MMNKKGQAALEFIMTYGWAILVVLVAVGALAYFGVLSPDKFLPSKCTLQAGIACVDHRVRNNGTTIRLTNSLGYDLSAITVSVENCGNSVSPANGNPTTLANGDSGTFNIDCAVAGSKYQGELNVSYTITDSGIQHNNVGEITTRVS